MVAYPTEVLENFNNLTAWQTLGLSVSGNKLVNATGGSNKDAWKDINSSNVFRVDFTITPNSATDVGAIFFGVSSAAQGSGVGDTSKWKAIGYRGAAGQNSFFFYDGATGSYNTIKPGAEVVADGTKSYKCQIISTGTEMFFTVSLSDGTAEKSYGQAVSFTANQLFSRIYDADDSVSKASFKNALSKYSDPTFDTPLILYPVINSQQNYIRVPNDYDGVTKRDMVLLCHGNGTLANSWQYPGDANYRPVNDTLVNAGYITGSSDTHGSSWGHPSAATDLKALYDYMQSMFNLNTLTNVLGNSMGGISALTFALTYPNLVKSLIGTAPVSDLTANYNNFSGAINTAFGCTAATMTNLTKKQQPYMRAKELINIPIKIWHAPDDVSVPYTCSVNLVNAINGYGGNATLITGTTGTGGHGSPSIWDNANIVSFFNASQHPMIPKKVNMYKFK